VDHRAKSRGTDRGAKTEARLAQRCKQGRAATAVSSVSQPPDDLACQNRQKNFDPSPKGWLLQLKCVFML
jgi:hypothetical protein